jgi:CRISPR-associated protein Cas1
MSDNKDKKSTFKYIESGAISSTESALIIVDTQDEIKIPLSSLKILLLGSGTTISHGAIKSIAATGICIIWVGEYSSIYYAHGAAPMDSSKLLMAQAVQVSNSRLRAETLRRMYAVRFPNENTKNQTIQQLRGKENTHTSASYREAARKTGVPWNSGEFRPGGYMPSDPLYTALAVTHSCLYSVVKCAIVALGCSPGLGFMHTGGSFSFVYDIADLYKALVAIPTAFDAARLFANNADCDIAGCARLAAIEAIRVNDIFEKCLSDIPLVLLGDEE